MRQHISWYKKYFSNHTNISKQGITNYIYSDEDSLNPIIITPKFIKHSFKNNLFLLKHINVVFSVEIESDIILCRVNKTHFKMYCVI